MKDYGDIVDALDAVTWYNGLAEIIVHWKDGDLFKNPWKWEVCDDYYDKRIRDQLEVIWMICVVLFGDYGTSPRTGWIEPENKQEFYHFINYITKTYREDLASLQGGNHE